MKWQAIKLLLFSFLIGVLFHYLPDRSREEGANQWKAFTKKNDRSVKLTHPSQKELAKIRSPHKSTTKKNTRKKLKSRRSPASPSPFPKRQGRILTGHQSKLFADHRKKLEMINTPHPNWERLAGVNLLRHRSPESKIYVKAVGSYIKVQNGKGQFVEKIIVTSLGKGGKESSFNAIVDSESGEILSTYNRTIHENFSAQQKPQWNVRAFQH